MLTARLPRGTGADPLPLLPSGPDGFTVPPCTGPNYQQSTSSFAQCCFGGEGGIRTLGTGLTAHTISSRAPSTARSPLQSLPLLPVIRLVFARSPASTIQSLRLWRRARDSNPRYPLGAHLISNQAPSTTRTALRGAKYQRKPACQSSACVRRCARSALKKPLNCCAQRSPNTPGTTSN